MTTNKEKKSSISQQSVHHCNWRINLWQPTTYAHVSDKINPLFAFIPSRKRSIKTYYVSESLKGSTHLETRVYRPHRQHNHLAFSALSKWRQFSGGGTLVKAIKHYRLSRGTPFECNIKACTINKSIFLVSARLELWQSISPLRQKSVIRREQRGGCATSKQAARLSSHLQSSRDRMLCSWGLGGGLSRVWAVAVPVEESKSSFPSLLTSQPLPFGN